MSAYDAPGSLDDTVTNGALATCDWIGPTRRTSSTTDAGPRPRIRGNWRLKVALRSSPQV